MKRNIAQPLVDMATQLGTDVPHLWEAMVRKTYYVSIAQLVLCVIFVAMAFRLLRVAQNAARRYKEYQKMSRDERNLLPPTIWDDEENAVTAVQMISVFFTFATVIIVGLALPDIIGGIASPEHYAARELINILEPKQ